MSLAQQLLFLYSAIAIVALLGIFAILVAILVELRKNNQTQSNISNYYSSLSGKTGSN